MASFWTPRCSEGVGVVEVWYREGEGEGEGCVGWRGVDRIGAG